MIALISVRYRRSQIIQKELFYCMMEPGTMSFADLNKQLDTIKSQKIPSERQSEIQTVNVVNTVRIKRTKCLDKLLQFIQLDENQCSSKEDRTRKQRCLYYFSKSIQSKLCNQKETALSPWNVNLKYIAYVKKSVQNWKEAVVLTRTSSRPISSKGPTIVCLCRHI